LKEPLFHHYCYNGLKASQTTVYMFHKSNQRYITFGHI